MSNDTDADRNHDSNDEQDRNTDHDRNDATRSDDQRRANTSRRTVLQGVAAGSVAGLGGLAAGRDPEGEPAGARQETTTQQGGGDGFFEEGTEVGTQVVADGDLTAPTDFAVAQGQNDRQYVTDQTGQVYVVTPDGLRDEPFVDVSDRMVELGRFYGLYASDTQDYDERGLLGIDFHPNFQENRKFYLHYSAPPTDELRTINWDHIEVVSEFRATEDLSSGDPDSERELLRLPHPQYNHDAGPMAFGPDGYLYVPMGDGGGANDNMYGHVPDWYDRNTGGNGQDIVHNLLGDILRIDVDSEGENTPYGIPDDNPFAGDAPGRDEIYAYGFRNPFGISFDSDGNMFVADAGQNLWEEADVVERGGNYGWNVKEGTHCFSTEQPGSADAITDCPQNAPDQPHGGGPLLDPVVEFPHQYQNEWVGITIVGGHRYEQSTISGMQGKYVYGVWTEDPTRQEPQGRILTADPPEDFGQGGGTQTTAAAEETTTAGNETTATGEQTTTQEAALQDQTTTEGGETTTADDGQVVPRDELWEMRELRITGGFDWFVRQFGRGADGEIYVLVSKRGVPEGDTGAVLKLVPPGEGDGEQTTTGGGETTTAADETTTVDTDETTTVDTGETTTVDTGETTAAAQDR
ncbi:PQQ-dependent sugar dehydrogenase [Halorussus salinus]|uniref:PQQ-dependent sugar dehydrogenase n=1 Tax=Halorussus salinus TaxID=1364935 RepID=UPI001092CEF0|nr:PQQ-dependent sugar dehydrogenase [Halorussus salinus]